MSLGKQGFWYFFRRCSNSHTNRDVLTNPLQNCDQEEETSIRTSDDSHIYCKKHFHQNPLKFRFLADFEADKETDNSGIGNRQLIILNKILCVFGII